MSKISLEKFIENTKGIQVDVPWKAQINLKGQCVSLIQQYISQCLEQEAKPRGNAADWVNTYVNEGLGTIVNDLKKGDLLVYPSEANGLGHIAIYVDTNRTYEQNNLRHDNGLAGYGSIFSSDYVILRPNAELYEEPVVEQPVSEPQVDLLDLVRKTIRGDFGNGEDRRNALGSNYDEVQRQVNLNIENGLTQWDNIRLF